MNSVSCSRAREWLGISLNSRRVLVQWLQGKQLKIQTWFQLQIWYNKQQTLKKCNKECEENELFGFFYNSSRVCG